MKKKLLSILLSAAMVLTSFSVPAFAAEDAAEDAVVEKTVSYNGNDYWVDDSVEAITTAKPHLWSDKYYFDGADGVGVDGYYYSENASEVANVAVSGGIRVSNFYSYMSSNCDYYTGEFRNMRFYFSIDSDQTVKDGEYDITVTLEDGTKFEFPKAVVVENPPESYIENVDISSEYDNYGEYFYMYMSGHNFDPQKLTYKITTNRYDEDEKNQQTFTCSYVSSVCASRDAKKEVWYVKLKKDKTSELKDYYDCKVEIGMQPGYSVKKLYTVTDSEGKDLGYFSAYINNDLFYSTYNSVANKVVLGLTQKIAKPGTQVSVAVYENHPSYSWKYDETTGESIKVFDTEDKENPVLFTATGTLNDENIVDIDMSGFKADQNNYYFRVTCGKYDEVLNIYGFESADSFTESIAFKDANGNVVCDLDDYNYNEWLAFEKGSIASFEAAYMYYNRDYAKDNYAGCTFTAELMRYPSEMAKETENVKIKDVTVTVADAEVKDVSTFKFKKLSLVVDGLASLAAYDDANYYINIYLAKGEDKYRVAEYGFEIPDTSIFTMDGTSYRMNVDEEGNAYVTIYTSYGVTDHDDNYVVSLKDEKLNDIAGLTTTVASYDIYGLTLKVAGLKLPEIPKDPGYLTYYVKVSNTKVGEPMYRYDHAMKYYCEDFENLNGDAVKVYPSSEALEGTYKGRARLSADAYIDYVNGEEMEGINNQPYWVTGFYFYSPSGKVEFPVTLTVTKPYNTDEVASIVYDETDVDEIEDRQSSYYEYDEKGESKRYRYDYSYYKIFFAKGELKGILPNPDDKYRLVLTDARGYAATVASDDVIGYRDAKTSAKTYSIGDAVAYGNSNDTLPLTVAKGNKLSLDLTALDEYGRATVIGGSKITALNVDAEPVAITARVKATADAEEKVYEAAADGKGRMAFADKEAKSLFKAKFNATKKEYAMVLKGNKKVASVEVTVKFTDKKSATFLITYPSISKEAKKKVITLVKDGKDKDNTAVIAVDGAINTYAWSAKKAVLNDATGRLELKAKDGSTIAEIYTKGNKAYVIGRAKGKVKLTAQYLNKKYNATVTIK